MLLLGRYLLVGSILVSGVCSQTTRGAVRKPNGTSSQLSATANARQSAEQGRTLGLLRPLLSLGLGGLRRGGRPPLASPLLQPGGLSSGVQSDPSVGGGVGYNRYPASNYYYGGYPYYGGYYGYRPNYYGGYYGGGQYGGGQYGGGQYGGGGYPSYGGGGYGAGGYGGGYPSYGGYSGYNTGYPSYGGASVGGYQPNYSGLAAASPTGVTTTSSIGAPGAANSAQSAQLAGQLGQALGASLRPLLAGNGGSVDANQLSSLLGLLG